MKKILALVLALILCLSLTAFAADPLIIGVQDDASNMARALKLLESAGFITIDPAAGFAPELADITEYLYNIEISPVAANTLTGTLDDYAASTINGTYAVPFGLVPSVDGLIIESQGEGGDNPFINIIVARTEDKDNEVYKKIVDTYHSQEVAEFILEEYKEAFFPVFDYNPEYEVAEDFVDFYTNYTSSSEGKQIVKIGVCGANNLMWNVVQKLLDDENAGIYIQLEMFDAYNLPNEALNAGELDLNNFQHYDYLKKECDANGYDLTAIGNTLIAPLTLYSKQFDSVDAIKDAAQFN